MSNKVPPPAKIEYNQEYVLRPVEPSDIPQIERALQISIQDLYVYMAWAHHVQSRSQFFDRVITQWWNYFRGDEYEMALFNQQGEFLVYTGFYPTARINPNCYEIGYWSSSAHKGKGYATLATKMQIALIFEYFKGDRVEITSSIENKASLQIIKKCGFHYEGEMRNFYPIGTEEMYANGYIKERRAALFALLPEDCHSLPWYAETVQKMTIYPVLDPSVALAYVSDKFIV